MRLFLGIVLCCGVLAQALGASMNAPRVTREAIQAEVCYDNYGCFSSNSPWTSLQRPLVSLPKAPHEVGTRFLLFTRNGDDQGYELLPNKDAVLFFSDFKATRKTIVLIHGFTDGHRTDWMIAAKNGLLMKEDYNILSVDWAPGAKSPYLQAIGNARLVGAQTAAMISFLERKGNMSLDDVHVIGHSLGAHIAGYLGDRLMGRLPHVTALDPIEPYFGGTDRMVRLDDADAQYVDTIHSNAIGALSLGLGMSDNVGHADFYPNGGKAQPGCKDLLGSLVVSIIAFITLNFEGALRPWACSHYRAADFFVESLSSNCPFIGHRCNSYNDFERGNCYSTCAQEGLCSPLGFGSRSFRNQGNYFLHTGNGDNRYCLQMVRVDAPVALSQKTTSGSLTIKLRNSGGATSSAFTIVDGRIAAGQLLNSWVEAPSHIVTSPSSKPALILRYNRGLLQEKSIELDSIALNIIDHEHQVQTLRYSGVTLQTGVDVQISS